MMKNVFAGIVAGVICLWAGCVVAAEDALTETMEGEISVNCASIGKQLQNVRYYDRRAREYLGNRYEKLFTSYVTNLNVRLVKNNISNVSLQELQLEIARAHAEFKNEYGRYATEMNVLIGMDCVNRPGEFYAKLVEVRARRAEVRGRIEKMNGKLDEYRIAVAEMRDLL